MKKTFVLALLAAMAGYTSAQEAMDAKQLFELGNNQFKDYDKALGMAAINPQGADPNQMGKMLMDGYNYMIKALPLDSLPDKKGKINPKYSKKIVSTVVGHVNDFFTAGGNYYNQKLYYPQAYEAFMVYADMPDIPAFAKAGETVNEEQRATAYFNAGLAAYSGNAVSESAAAFKKARLNNYKEPEAYIYEIACWQNMAQKDSTLDAEAQRNINEIAQAGYARFGVDQPVFLNNLINAMIADNRSEEALAMLNKEVAAHPDNANLYGLLGFTYNRLDKEEEAEAAYRKAASLPSVDYETLLRAASRIFRIGTEKLNLVEGNSAEAREQRANLKTNYFETAKTYLEKAKGMASKPDPMLNNLLESVDYALTTYFPQ